MDNHLIKKNKRYSYKIYKDNTLRYPDKHREVIFQAKDFENNPTECYDLNSDSPFGVTTKTLEFYKKTTSDNRTDLYREYIIAKIVVPIGTQIHFEDGDPSNSKKKRVALGIVKNQFHYIYNKDVTHSISQHDNSFKYKTGDVVTPKEKFYDLVDWINNGCDDVACESGIHVFSDEHFARKY